MDEMMEDVLAAEDDEEIEAEADAEVDNVLFELTDGKLGQAGAARTELPVCHTLCHSFVCVLTWCAGGRRDCQRRGVGEDNGTVPSSAQRASQLNKLHCLYIMHLEYTLPLSYTSTSLAARQIQCRAERGPDIRQWLCSALNGRVNSAVEFLVNSIQLLDFVYHHALSVLYLSCAGRAQGFTGAPLVLQIRGMCSEPGTLSPSGPMPRPLQHQLRTSQETRARM
jgi:hypothetical protein